jgi:hypothetical protein
VRFAALEVAGEPDVHVWYRHEYATGDVDLIASRIGSATSPRDSRISF